MRSDPAMASRQTDTARASTMEMPSSYMPDAEQRSRRMQVKLPARPEAARRARHLASQWIELPERTSEDLLLIVSELIGNAVRHGSRSPDDMLVFAMSVEDSAIRVEVRDTGPGMGFERDWEAIPASGGFGLRIITRLASRWGTGPQSGLVWVELDL